jgi:hypothetical protein
MAHTLHDSGPVVGAGRRGAMVGGQDARPFYPRGALRLVEQSVCQGAQLALANVANSFLLPRPAPRRGGRFLDFGRDEAFLKGCFMCVPVHALRGKPFLP